MCNKDIRERLRIERIALYKNFSVGRIVSCEEDASRITIIVEFRWPCVVSDKKAELAKYLVTILGKKVHVITPPPSSKY